MARLGQTLLRFCTSIFSSLASVCLTLWEALLHWLNSDSSSAGTEPGAAAAKTARKQRRQQKQAAAAAAAAAQGAKARSSQPPPASDSDSESEEEEEQPAPAATSGAFAAFARVEPGWEAVASSRHRKPKQPAPGAGGSTGPKIRPAAAAGKKQQQAGEVRGVCARPECGNFVAKGFAKCARCKVFCESPCCLGWAGGTCLLLCCRWESGWGFPRPFPLPPGVGLGHLLACLALLAVGGGEGLAACVRTPSLFCRPAIHQDPPNPHPTQLPQIARLPA